MPVTWLNRGGWEDELPKNDLLSNLSDRDWKQASVFQRFNERD